MVEDHDSERLTDIADAVAGPYDGDDDPIGMRVGPGTEVGGYVVDGELGRGGMGVVYSATHPVIGKRAAIKILRPEVSRSAITVERFIQEARAVNQIHHPNIVDIFAYGALPDGRAYHVMDLLVGESLRRRLKRGVLHPSEAASVIDEVASALIAAHDQGFVHRDLKPDNVFLVTRDGRWPEVKLLDFGLAKLMPERGIPAFTTKVGVMLGTPEYMSPEQARGIGVDYRTDIYALGVVMFEILAGTRPFPVLGDSFAILQQHAEEPPLSLADTIAGLPDEMVQLVDAMLAKTPQARPSLAAVRTVIKRLRTTKLPTRSVAGEAMASFNQPPGLGITPSRFGAEALLPGDPLLGRHGAPQTTARGLGLDARGANPNAPRVPASSQPLPTSAQPRAQSPSQPLPGSPQSQLGAPRAQSSQPLALPAQSQLAAPRSHAPSSQPPYHDPNAQPGAPRSHAPSSQPLYRDPNAQPGAPRSHTPSSQPLYHDPHATPLHPDAGRAAGTGCEPAQSSGHLAPPAGPSPHALRTTPSGSQPPDSLQRARSDSASGARSPDPRRGSQRLPSTILGVAPPKLPSGATAAVAPPRYRRGWLVLAVLLMAAAATAMIVLATGA